MMENWNPGYAVDNSQFEAGSTSTECSSRRTTFYDSSCKCSLTKSKNRGSTSCPRCSLRIIKTRIGEAVIPETYAALNIFRQIS